jgi:Predicted endonuclease distantly related to archaeal Holliday junction resolvase
MKFVAFLIRKFAFIFAKKRTNQRPKDILGRDGEKKTAAYLKREGYKIVDRNVRFSNGEIDIIAVIGKTLAIIEVKTRQSSEHCHPLDVVDKKKREKIKQMGLRYYRDKKYAARGIAIRFDVVTVLCPKGKQAMIEHFVDAFR